jgi:riboflavin-specific deaminase-like protein
MRQLLPEPAGDVDGPELYRADRRAPLERRPWLAVNMVQSADGATALQGRSGGLGGPADRAIFTALRSIADVILVGAGTVRAEHYGPPRTSARDQRLRLERGQEPHPRIAVVSGRLDLDPEARLFSDPARRPLVLTVEKADAERRARLAAVADVIDAGDTTFDPLAALATLRETGAGVVLCEGGPALNGELVNAGVIDELCLTIAPLLVAGPSPRCAHGAEPPQPEGLALSRVLEEDGTLFLRYLRRELAQ